MYIVELLKIYIGNMMLMCSFFSRLGLKSSKLQTPPVFSDLYLVSGNKKIISKKKNVNKSGHAK
jgi:hypothetical protein